MDAVLDYMKEKNIPLTKENYLDLNYLGNPPESLGGEEESEIPEEIQGQEEPEHAGIDVLGK
jgi:hypothetical protein